MNPDCCDAIHLLLCGSNYLLVYNQTGSAFNQMFQSYETIPVGQMLASDIQEMIHDWLAQYPYIRFAESQEGDVSPSIKWIERYTGGLVWYTRLLVNEATKAVIKDNRNCVYPSDICQAFNSICVFNYCRQLTEGCDKNDKLVLDAMQSLSIGPNTYVSFEQLMGLLGEHMSVDQLRRSLSTLIESVELLEQRAANVKSYRFRIELYRRYFRTRPSIFEGDVKQRPIASVDCFTLVETSNEIHTSDSDSEFIV